MAERIAANKQYEYKSVSIRLHSATVLLPLSKIGSVLEPDSTCRTPTLC